MGLTKFYCFNLSTEQAWHIFRLGILRLQSDFKNNAAERKAAMLCGFPRNWG